MRLINVKTYEIEEFYGDQIPQYVALSHTWLNGQEPTFLEWVITFRRAQKFISSLDQNAEVYIDALMRSYLQSPKKERGFNKIVAFLQTVAVHKIAYGWVDTVCIDKSSSADLSEAINSMAQIYRNCDFCFAYLSDCTLNSEETFVSSRWFTRGWTLQELLFPRQIYFFNSNWIRFGTKEDLAEPISNITGIPESQLKSLGLNRSSIAQRMSWASKRETTRPEDVSYCLLGLFEINMPLLYSEGRRAFMRLQEEIMKSSDDDSIFAWASPNSSLCSYRGLLAESPADFASCGKVRFRGSKSEAPFWITNKGIQITLKARSVVFAWPGQFSALLECENLFTDSNGRPTWKRVTIRLHPLAAAGAGNQFVRVLSNTLSGVPMWMSPPSLQDKTIFVRQNCVLPLGNQHVPFIGRGLCYHGSWREKDVCFVKAWPEDGHNTSADRDVLFYFPNSWHEEWPSYENQPDRTFRALIAHEGDPPKLLELDYNAISRNEAGEFQARQSYELKIWQLPDIFLENFDLSTSPQVDDTVRRGSSYLSFCLIDDELWFVHTPDLGADTSRRSIFSASSVKMSVR